MRALVIILLYFSFLFSSQNLQKITVQLEWKHQFEFAGFYAAIQQGYYEDLGIEVHLKEYDSHIDIVSDVIDKKAHFGLSSSSLMLAKTSKKPVVLLASYFKQNVLALVTQKDITNLKQLENKKVMVTPAEVSHSSIGAMLKESNLSSKSINFVNHDFSIEKFKNKEVSAMSVFLTNQLYLLDKNDIKYNVFVPEKLGLFSYDLELFTSEEFARENSKLVKGFIEATKKGWQYAFENKEEIINLIHSKYSKVKSKDALRFEANETQRLFKTDVFTIGSIAPELIKLNYDMYNKLGLIKEKIDIHNLIENYVYNDKLSRFLKYNFTKEELLYLKSNPIIKVQNETSFPPYNYVFNNKSSGFSIEYIKLLASKVGLNLEFEKGTWDETLKKAKNKQIDILLNTAKTPKRLKYLNFLDQPYIYSDLVLLVNTQNKSIQDARSLKQLSGKTIAVVKGFYEEEVLKKYYPNIKLLVVKNSLTALKAVSYGKADGTLFGLLEVANYHMNKHSITNVKPLFDVNDNKLFIELYVALSKNNKTLTSILNKVQDNLEETEILALKNKIFRFYRKEKEAILTKSQLEYLKDIKTIKMCNNQDFSPIEFKDDNNNYTGVAIDVLKEIEKKLEVKFENVPTKSWKESQEFLKNRKCDILPAVVKTKARESYANFTKAYLPLDLVVITTKDKPYVSSFDDISDKTISRKKGSGLIDLLKQKDKKIKIIQKDSYKESFLCVSRGESYATVATLPVAYNIIKKYGLDNLQIAGYLDMKYNLSIAVRDDDIYLYDILNNTLKSIPNSKIKTILDEWSSVKVLQQADYSNFYKVIFLILLLLLVFIYWNKKLSKEKLKAKKAMQEARKANEVKSQFLANMSHEVRTPMNGILGMLHLALETNLTIQQRTYLEKIDKSAKDLVDIIDDILDISKIEAGKLSLKEDNFNLKDMINSVLYLLKEKANQKGLKLEVNFDENLEQNYYGDSLRISQIVLNLLHNSIKFTNKGKVELSISSIEKNRLRFEVKDTGVGISKEYQEKLFDSFFQVDATDTRKYGGSGLGLSISKQLVELMNGKLQVQSEENQGSKFTFEIEVKEGSKEILQVNSEVKKAKKEDIEALAGSSILLVEDNSINQDIICSLLEKNNISIDIANNGKEAVELYKQNQEKYELIFMDIQMPVMDGFEASKQIRKLSKDIPIVALTASAMKGDEQKVKESNMNYHLKKPMDIQELYVVLVKYLPKKVQTEVKQADQIDLDFEYLDKAVGLKNVGGNKKLYIKILNRFRNDYKTLKLEELDEEEFKRVTHTIKGLSQTIGATSFSKVAKELSDTHDNSLIPKFYKQLKLLLEELEQKLPDSSTIVDNRRK